MLHFLINLLGLINLLMPDSMVPVAAFVFFISQPQSSLNTSLLSILIPVASGQTGERRMQHRLWQEQVQEAYR